MRTCRLALILGCLAAPGARAQQESVAALLASARRLAAAQQLDSAVVVLNHVADAKTGGSAAERGHALVLLGVVRFYQGQDSLTAAAFRSALALDTTLEVSGLEQIDSLLPHLFEDARAQAISAAREVARRPHSCIRRCLAGETPPRLHDIPQLVLDSGPDFMNTHAVLAVLLVVSENGVPEPETIRIESSTMPPLNSQVLEAVRAAHFEPALANGIPVRALIELRFEFRAEGMTAITYRIEGP
ncbi:MAG TPA: TonB family protein [Gemmatimonadales bacterium]